MTASRVAGIVLLATVAASYHVKAIAFAPIALACVAASARGRDALAARLIAAGTLVAMFATAAAYWVGRFKCPDNAVIAQQLAKENLASAIAAHAPWHQIALQAVRGANPLSYASLAVPRNTPMSWWIPDHLFPEFVPPVFKAVMLLLWYGSAFLAAVLLAHFLWREKIRALAEPRALLALVILACISVWGASQVNRNVYEAAQVLPLLAVFLALCLTLPAPQAGWVKCVLPWTIPVAAAAALTSQIVLLAFTTGPLLAASRTPGYLANQKFSASIGGYATIRSDISLAMAKAGIAQDRRLRGLMVDDITYLALQRHLLPFHRLGVVDPTWNGNLENPAKYLVSRGSDGIVAGCRYLPKDLERAAARSGEVCAISRATLARLVAAPSSIPGDK
jgi:hypothetical protein